MLLLIILTYSVASKARTYVRFTKIMRTAENQIWHTIGWYEDTLQIVKKKNKKKVELRPLKATNINNNLTHLHTAVWKMDQTDENHVFFFLMKIMSRIKRGGHQPHCDCSQSSLLIYTVAVKCVLVL